jgi:hypothetical protein
MIFIQPCNKKLIFVTSIKKIRSMKRIICHLLLACFLLLGVSITVKAGDIPLCKTVNVHRAPSISPSQTQQQLLTASINEKLISFQSSEDINNATVSIVASDGTIIYSETIDMVMGIQYTISMDNYNSGDYSVVFKCGSVTYRGYFVVE